MVEPKTEKVTDTVVMIGNPGVGKSTLLNGLLGSVEFKSGVSYGQRLTTVLQEHIYEGRRFIDTPGLSDIKMRKEAGKEITEALKKGGIFRIIFVVNLEAGRLKPDDRTLMQLVSEGIHLKANDYGIIVNKVAAKTRQRIEAAGVEFTEMINYGMSGTQHLCLNPYDHDLEDEENVVVESSPELKDFLSKIPIVVKDPSMFDDLKDHKYAALLQNMQEQLEAMRNDIKLLQEKYEKICEK